MAWIGINLPRAILSDGGDTQRFGFSTFTERADSGMTLRRQAGGLERAVAGIPSTAEVRARAEQVTSPQFDWLFARIGIPLQLRMPTGFSARVAIASLNRRLVSARSDTTAWGVDITFFILERT